MTRRRERPPRATGGDEGIGANRAHHTPDPVANLLDPDGLVSRVTSRCILCKAPSALVGLLFPHDSRLWGAPAGKDRVIGYGVCSACYARPDMTDAVEERIFGYVAGGAA